MRFVEESISLQQPVSVFLLLSLGQGAFDYQGKGCSSKLTSDVAIPGLEPVPVPDFEVFSENCDSDSNSGSNRCWN